MLKVSFIEAYTYLGKTWAKTALLRQNQIVTILRKQVVKQAVGGAKGNSEIMTIPNRYKDIFDDFIDSSDAESLDRPEPIDKGLRNTSRSDGSPTRLLKRDCLNKNILDRLSQLVPKTRDTQMYQHYDVAPFGFKSGESRYKKVQRGEEDGKG